MTSRLRGLWETPRIGDAPGPLPRDWVLVAVFLALALGEGILRSDLAWRPVALLLAVVIVLCLPWRRARSGVTVPVAFGGIAIVQISSILIGTGAPVGLTSSVCVLLIAYAAARWGSGQTIALLGCLLLLIFALGFHRDYRTLSDAIGEAVILSIPVLLGIGVRTQVTMRARAVETIRVSEREQLARELHDTVAHHVSAMVVRAQAGRVVAESRPEAAIEALRVIEQEGSRTLAEMRVLVGALRGDGGASLAPAVSLRDISDLADATAAQTRVIVTMAGELEDVHPSVAAAVYRIAQESITNARRHATRASVVSVDLQADADDVVLVVRDDGQNAKAITEPGFGIVGMSERASLLGGSLSAGPTVDGGWVVESRIPRTGVRR